MRPRTLDVFEKHFTPRHTPCPTQYNSIDMEPKNGRFTYAGFSDIKLSSMNMKSDRFEKIKESPGPSSYGEKDTLKGDAKYLLSNHRGNGTRAFGQTARFTKEKWTNVNNPGPGNYEKPSDFGAYGDAKYYKTMGNFSTIK
jgi:hypothetical protein